MKSKFHYWQCIKKLEFFSETKVILTGYYQKTKKRRKENILLQLCSCSYLYGFWKNNHINCWPKCVKFFLNISCRPHVVENKLHNLQLNCDINELFWWKEEASLSSMLYIFFFYVTLLSLSDCFHENLVKYENIDWETAHQQLWNNISDLFLSLWCPHLSICAKNVFHEVAYALIITAYSNKYSYYNNNQEL